MSAAVHSSSCFTKQTKDIPAIMIPLFVVLKYTRPAFLEKGCSGFHARGAGLQVRGRSGTAYEVDTTDGDARVLKQRIVGEISYESVHSFTMI